MGWKKLIKSGDLSGDGGRVKHKLACWLVSSCVVLAPTEAESGHKLGERTLSKSLQYTLHHNAHKLGDFIGGLREGEGADTKNMLVLSCTKKCTNFTVYSVFSRVHVYTRVHRFTTLDTNWVTWVETEGGWRGWRQTPAKDFLLTHDDDDFTKNILCEGIFLWTLLVS